MSTVAQLMVKIGADVTDAQRGLSSINNTVNSTASSMGQSLTSAGSAIKGFGRDVAGISIPVAAGLGAAAVATANFDRELRNIQSIGRQTNDEIAALGDQFIALSQDASATTDSATALAAGFYQIQSSGFAGADAMTILEASTMAASAGLTDTDTAARAILATLNAYGLAASDAASVSDVLFRTVDLGVLSFEELATNLGDIVGTGNIAKVSLEELGGAMAVLTRNGISAAESSTALNRLILAFISPSAQAQKAASELGVELNATTLAQRGLLGAMQDISVATGGNAEAMAALFPNVRALKAALALTRDEAAPFADIMGQMAENSGAAERAFATQSQSFVAQSAQMRNTMQALAIELGQELMPILVDVARAILPIVRAFTNLPEPVKKVIVVVGLFVAAITPVAMAVGSIVSAIGAVMPVLGAVGGAFGALVPAIASAVAAIVAALGPILIIIAVIAAAVLAFKLAWDNNFLEVRDTLQAVWQAIQPIFGAIKQIVMDVMAFIRGEITLGDLVERISGQLIVIRDAFMNAFTILGQWLAGIWSRSRRQFSTHWSAIAEEMGLSHSQAVELVTNAWNTIAQIVTTAWEYIRSQIELYLTIISGVLEAAWILISELVRATWEEIKMIIEVAMIAIKTLIVAIMQALSGDWEGRVEYHEDGRAQIVERIKTGVMDILGGLVSGVYERGKALAERFGQGILDALNSAFEAAKRVAQAIRDLLPGSDAKVGPLRDLGAAGRAFSERFAEGIRLGAMEAVSAANSLAGQLMPAYQTRPFELAAQNFFGGAGALSGAHPTRPFEVAPAGSFGGAPQGNQPGGQCITINIYNPTGRPSEESIMLALKKLAAVGVLNPV